MIGVRAAENETEPWTTVALRGSDGEQLWAGPVLDGTGLVWQPPALILAGPGRAIVSGQSEDFKANTVVIDTATGQPVVTIPEILRCLYDDRNTAVCSKYTSLGELSNLVIGVDVTSGTRLWKLPDEAAGRTALNVTAVFHGAVYGQATRTSVILDARTGADLVSESEIAPTHVVPGYGLVTSAGDNKTTVAHQATG